MSAYNVCRFHLESFIDTMTTPRGSVHVTQWDPEVVLFCDRTDCSRTAAYFLEGFVE